MTKIRSVIGQHSGSQGGTTYAHNKGGAYTRMRSIPTNPSSTRQTFVRTNLATLSRAWSDDLTQAQRDAWALWALDHPVTNVFGDPILLSGQCAYIQLNARLLSVGAARDDDPPSTAPPLGLLSYSVVCDESAQDIIVTYTATPLPAGTFLVVNHTPPGQAGIDPNYRQSRYAGNSAAAAASPQTVNPWAPFVTGQRVNVYLFLMDAHGQVSPYFKVSVIVTA